MRCYCCNRNLSDYESTLRSGISGQFLDMCKKCLKDMDIPIVEPSKELDHQAPDDGVEEEEFDGFN